MTDDLISIRKFDTLVSVMYKSRTVCIAFSKPRVVFVLEEAKTAASVFLFRPMFACGGT